MEKNYFRQLSFIFYALLLPACNSSDQQGSAKADTGKPVDSVAIVDSAAKTVKVDSISKVTKSDSISSWKELMKVGKTPLFMVDSALVFKAGMAIDADGSPRAYHPQNKGLDFLANAGKPGNWYGIVTDKNGNPYIQTNTDPNPGYYVSATSLQDGSKAVSDPNRYVNSETIPYIVLPPQVRTPAGVKLGDIGMVYNLKTQKLAYVIFADSGPKDKIGEGSIALGNAIGVGTDLRGRKAGISEDSIVYILFPKSGNGKPRTKEEVDQIGAARFEAWGGESKMKLFLNRNH